MRNKMKSRGFLKTRRHHWFLLAVLLLLRINVVVNDNSDIIDYYNTEALISQCMGGALDVFCHPHLKVAWVNWRPYLYKLGNNSSTTPNQGALAKILSTLKSTCQRKCVHKEILNIGGRASEIVYHNSSKGVDPKFEFDKEFGSYTDLMAYLKRQAKKGISENGPRLFMPIASTEKYQQTMYGLPFVFSVESPGILYVERNVKEDFVSLIWQGMIKSWHLLAMVVLLSMLTGIFIWFFERKRNVSMFPAPFLEGSGVGFWFAFVTMTTVGYGDKSPKTLPGRIICLIWMMIGLCLFPLLMANFTGLINSDQTNSLYGKKVAVIKEGPETGCAEFENAYTIEKNTYEEVLTTVALKEADAALIGKPTGYYLKKKIENKQLRITRTFQCDIRVGIVGIPSKKKKSINFIQKLRLMDRQCLTTVCKNSLLAKALQEVVQETVISGKARYRGIDIYLPILVLSGIVVLAIVFGLTWQVTLAAKKYYRRETNTVVATPLQAYPCRNGGLSYPEVSIFAESIVSSSSQGEKYRMLHMELQEFCSKFYDKLQDVEKDL